MHAFTVHPQKKPVAPVEPEQPPSRRRRRHWLLVLLLLIAFTSVAWAVRRDPHLARVKALQQELSSAESRSLPPEERQAKREELRTEMSKLSDIQKKELFAPLREKRNAEMQRYYAMTPDEKAQYLDEQINRSEKWRQNRDQQAGTAGATGGSTPGGTGGTRGAGPRGGGNGPGGGNAGGADAGAGAPGGPGSNGPTPEDRLTRRKQFLDDSTPEERAMRDLLRKDLSDRRVQLGLPSSKRSAIP